MEVWTNTPHETPQNNTKLNQWRVLDAEVAGWIAPVSNVCAYVYNRLVTYPNEETPYCKSTNVIFDHTAKIAERELTCSRNRRALCSVNLVKSKEIDSRNESNRIESSRLILSKRTASKARKSREPHSEIGVSHMKDGKAMRHEIHKEALLTRRKWPIGRSDGTRAHTRTRLPMIEDSRLQPTNEKDRNRRRITYRAHAHVLTRFRYVKEVRVG